MVVRGWDACGLLAPYKPELAQQCIDKANAAMCDTEHPFYPLFTSNDRTQPPPGGEEPTPGPCEVGADGPSAGDAEEQQIGERADAIIAAAAEAGPVAPANAGKRPLPEGGKLFPIFAKQAKKG